MFAELAAAVFMVASPGAPVSLAPAYVDDARVLLCDGRAGTVWRVSGDRYVTALHVNRDSACTMDGLPIRTIGSEPGLDISYLSSSRGVGREYQVDCGGFVPGEAYVAIGWANGLTLVAMPMIATGMKVGGNSDFATLDVLLGRAFRGQSGGPMVRVRTGRVAGIVNAGDDFGTTLARPLRETALCSGHI